MMQLPLLCTSPPFLISPITPPLLSTAWSFLSYLQVSSALHCPMQLPLLLCSSPLLHLSSPPSNSSAALLLRFPLHDAVSSPLICRSLLHLSPLTISLLRCSPLRDAASSPICSSHLLHLTPLLLSSDLHCMMQFPLLSSADLLSSLLHLSPLTISLLRCSPLRDAASSPLPSAALISI